MVAARRHPGWTRFHRQCGDLGVFFATEAHGSGYRTTAIRYEKVGDGRYREIDIASADAALPIPSVVAAFEVARDSGDVAGSRLPSDIAELLAEGAISSEQTATPQPAENSHFGAISNPAPATPAVDDMFASLLGGDPVMELIG